MLFRASSVCDVKAAASHTFPVPVVRASLSGTLLQRKDVVNQCLEFGLGHDRTTPAAWDPVSDITRHRLAVWDYESGVTEHRCMAS